MISDEDFACLQTLLLQRCGMALTSDKLYLIGSRLGPVAQRLGLRGVIDLAAALRARPSDAMINAVVEAMVTHESLFFRDGKPFDQVRMLAPELMRVRAARKQIRVWSAACSSGQEAYSLAMQISEDYPHAAGWRWDIVGTDISAPILEKARQGVFSAFEIKRGLSEYRVSRHFRALADGTYRVSDDLRRMVTFRPHNLLDPAAHLGMFDIVFCRNVLIYFDAPSKTRALDIIARQMAPDGLLFLGGAESVAGVSDKFVGNPHERGLFRLADAPVAKIA